jgi:Holliday junction resolvase-like predicted endonuclease
MKRKEAPSARGARYEIVAAASLMASGWTVFRSLSPVGGTDLIIQRRKTLLRVQVRSAMTLSALRGNDVLAVVSADGSVRYYVKHRHKWTAKLPPCELLRRKKAA